MRRTVMGLCALALAASVLSPSAGAEIVGDEVDATTETRGVVYIIPIRGMIEPALLYVIRRGLDEAKIADARAIVFVMDTPGGTLNAASEIVRTIQKLSVPTYTFVEKDAFSAGAIIALSTEHIYMAPGSVIGDAMPIMMTPFGGAQEMPDDLKEKAVSAVAALVRSAAQKSGHREDLAEKMVRREIELKIGDVVICPTGRLLTLTNVEAAQPVGADSRPLLSEGTVQDLDELLLRTGLEDAERKELAVTGAERVARFIASFAPLFLIAGLLGIYIEVKTPGFGLPGILGILSLAVFFWGHHIAGLAGMEDLVIFLVGAVLLAVEILLIPGFGFAGQFPPLYFFDPEHINHFDRESLEFLAGRSQLSVVESGRKSLRLPNGSEYPAIFSVLSSADPIGRAFEHRRDSLYDPLVNYATASLAGISSLRARVLAMIGDATPFVLWGAGSLAQRLMGEPWFPVQLLRGIVDRDTTKHGMRLAGKTITSPEKGLRDLPPGTLVLCAAAIAVDQIEKDYRTLGFTFEFQSIVR